MRDARIDRLAQLLVSHSTRLQAGEKVLIECFDLPGPELPAALVRAAAERGAVPIVVTKQNAVLRAMWLHATEEMVRTIGAVERQLMEEVQAYVGIRGAANVSELADVPPEKMDLYRTYIWQPVHIGIRIRRTKWVVLRYPTPSMAQLAGMSTEAFEDFYFDVCTVDYPAMARALEPLAELMRRTDQVRLVGPDTDLTFSIKGIGVVPCAGEHNIPDGEVFTAPVRDSVNGYITFNTPTIYEGVTFERVRLEFQEGKIVRATASSNERRLNEILDADEGARYIGEFAIGCNPKIREPMKDILFDEKIAGSIHLTPGNAYEEADNGNRSKVHWDMVLIQRPEYGGGEMYFDGRLVRKDGEFVLPELQRLNEGF